MGPHFRLRARPEPGPPGPRHQDARGGAHRGRCFLYGGSRPGLLFLEHCRFLAVRISVRPKGRRECVTSVLLCARRFEAAVRTPSGLPTSSRSASASPFLLYLDREPRVQLHLALPCLEKAAGLHMLRSTISSPTSVAGELPSGSELSFAQASKAWQAIAFSAKGATLTSSSEALLLALNPGLRKVAEPYPPDLLCCAGRRCGHSGGVGWSARRFCIAACAKCSGARIGEASNPGPRKRRLAGDAPDLALAETVGPQTARLHLTSIRGFAVWLHSEGNDLSMEELIAMPEVAGRLLRKFGLFLRSQALYFYLITVTALQRAGPSLRRNLPFAWELAGTWRHQQPVMHRRPPLPEALLRAMAVFSHQWGWRRFTGVLFLAFFGVCRPGEPLSALRRRLLLPHDFSTDGSRVPHDREPKIPETWRSQMSACIYQG